MRIPAILLLPLLLLSFPMVAGAEPHVKPAGGWNGPIIGKNVKGSLVEVRTGDVLEAPMDVTLYAYAPERYVIASHKDGRVTLAGGKPGDPGAITLDAARFEAGTRTRVGARSFTNVSDFKATLVAVNAGVGGGWSDDPDALNDLQGRVDFDASIGAQGVVETKVGLTGKALVATAGGEALLGARTSGQITGAPTLCGAKVVATARGQVSLGIGGAASLGLRVDWAKWSVKGGGKLAGTYGVGLGGGTEIEISLEKIVNDPRAAGRCVTDGAKAGIQALSDGYDRIEKAGAQLLADVITGAKYWRTGVPVPTGSNPPGSNVGRFEETRPLGAPRPPATMSGGGVSR